MFKITPHLKVQMPTVLAIPCKAQMPTVLAIPCKVLVTQEMVLLAFPARVDSKGYAHNAL